VVVQSNGQKALDKQTKNALKGSTKNKKTDSFLSNNKNSPKAWKSPVAKKTSRGSATTGPSDNNVSLAQG